MDPLHPIDVRLSRDVDPVTHVMPVRLTPAEREAARERREQARKRRQKAQPGAGGAVSRDGHVDLTA